METLPQNQQQNQHKRKLGFLMVAIGCFLCVFGFLLTLWLLDQGANFEFAMYGATGLGGLLLLAGMVIIMG